MIVHFYKSGLLVYLTFLVCDVKCEDPCDDLYTWVPKMDGDLVAEVIPVPNVTEICSNITCITKCCPPSEVHFTSSLQDWQGCRSLPHVRNLTDYAVDKWTNFDYTELSFYKRNAENDIIKSELTLENVTVRFNDKFYSGITSCTSGIYSPGNDEKEKYFMIQGDTPGSLTLETENHNLYESPKWGKDDFCFEYLVDQVVNKEDNSTKLSVKIHFLRYPNPVPEGDSEYDSQIINSEKYAQFRACAFIISSFFLLLVLVVYGSLPELRKIAGMVQMAYCATYLTALILNAVLILIKQELLDADRCRSIAVVNYYMLFSSFFWLNIMSFDIWWSFRGWYKQRRIHRQGELVKFGWYSLYAWGTPLLITTAVVIIDTSDLRRYTIIKPHFENCFRDTIEFRFYYNAPIGVLLLANIFFFGLTAYSYWRIKKDLDKYQDSDSSNRKVRFMMYLKLAVIMGVGWIFDVMALPECLEIISSIYNGLIGVAIFFVFVFKRKILIKFCQRYGLQHRFTFLKDLERKWTSTKTQRENSKRSVVDSDSGIQMEQRPNLTMSTAL